MTGSFPSGPSHWPYFRPWTSITIAVKPISYFFEKETIIIKTIIPRVRFWKPSPTIESPLFQARGSCSKLTILIFACPVYRTVSWSGLALLWFLCNLKWFFIANKALMSKSSNQIEYVPIDWIDIHRWLNTWLTTSIGDGIWLHAEKFKNPKIKFKNRILIFSTKSKWYEIKSTWIHFQSNLIDLNLHLQKLFGWNSKWSQHKWLTDDHKSNWTAEFKIWYTLYDIAYIIYLISSYMT